VELLGTGCNGVFGPDAGSVSTTGDRIILVRIATTGLTLIE